MLCGCKLGSLPENCAKKLRTCQTITLLRILWNRSHALKVLKSRAHSNKVTIITPKREIYFFTSVALQHLCNIDFENPAPALTSDDASVVKIITSNQRQGVPLRRLRVQWFGKTAAPAETI
jgi:hypothetical protein